MLKRIYFKKIMVATLALLALFLLYLMPNEKNAEYDLSTDNLEYVYSNKTETIYLLDSNDYIARTTIKGCDCNTEEEAKDVIEGLTIGGEKSNIIPNGFRSILPSGTEVISLNLDNKTLTINFSKELLDINSDYEEKMLESIIYTLTSIDGIDKVIIQVEGEVLNKLPNSNKTLPTTLDKSYGINKTYDIVNTSNIESYTVYYVSNYNDNEYYVPVTKYINSKGDDKVKIIIDELSSSPIHETNLMSYLDANVSLIDYDLSDDILKLNFSNSILDNSTSNQILEEVIYTISLSVSDNYNVKEVDFLVDNKEIYKKTLKTLE
jgi:germination protein M